MDVLLGDMVAYLQVCAAAGIGFQVLLDSVPYF